MSEAIENYQAGAWSAALICAETNKQIALEIINMLELKNGNCDTSDWKDLSTIFGNSEKLMGAVNEYDNIHS